MSCDIVYFYGSKQYILKKVYFKGQFNSKITFKKFCKDNGYNLESFLRAEFNLGIKYCELCGTEIPLLYAGSEKTFDYDIETNSIIIKFNKAVCCRKYPCESKCWNPVSKLFLSKIRGYTVEETNKILSDKGIKSYNTLKKQGYYDDISNNPYSKAFWIKKGYSEEEVNLIISQKCQKSVQTKRYSGYYDDISNNPYSKAYWIKNGMSEQEAQIKVNSRNWVCDEFIHEKLPEHLRGRTISIDYGIEVLGLSVEAAIERYEIIKQKFKEVERTIDFKLNYNMASKESMVLFKKIYKIIRKLYNISRDDIYFAINKHTNGEYFVRNDNNKILFYDFVIKSKKICIEYNGIHVHPHPNLTENEKQHWKHAYNKNSYYDQLIIDINKIQCLENKGFKVLQIWSNDCLDHNLTSILKFIEENVYEKN